MMSKMKFSTALLGSLLTVSMAQAAEGSAGFKSGFYTGALLGYNSMRTNTSEAAHSALEDSSQSLKKTSGGLAASLLGGYRKFLSNNFLLGGELGVSWDNNQTRQTGQFGPENAWTGSTKIKAPFKFTPAVVLGGKFSNTWLGFIKFGPSIAQFKGTHSIQNEGDPQYSIKFNKTKVGFMGAVGVEHAVTSSMSVIALTSYENYGRITKTGFNVSEGGVGDTDTIKVKSSNIAAKIGVVYTF